MAFQIQDLHFVLIPMLSQSYLLPLTDLAKLLAQHGVTVSIITTPLNAARFQAMIDRATSSNLKIRLIPLRFPCQEAGLPEGCENMDVLTSRDLVKQFFMATYMLQEPVEKLIAALEPLPSCIITSAALPWTSGVAIKFNIPRFIFHHISSFHLLCANNIASSGVDANAGSDTEPFLVPNVPDSIELTRAQLPDEVNRSSDVMMKGALDQMKEFELSADAVLVNSFDEFESRYAEEYGKVWAEEKQLGVLVKKEHVKEAIYHLMNGGEDAEDIRRRVQMLGEAAKRAMDEGGSSHWNMTTMIQNVMKRVNRHVLIPEYNNLHGPCSPVTPPASLQLMFKSGRAAS
ncbi:hypothetical protein Acr_07g0003390 [Actinidia rufa]|uniref:Uncharacterized protein n=1 Tax=Actinidia rufa TaxID=165716 RepID=A0A7J0EUT6_9ERIC|nr:hypothetical protein Acr_07g0003390 [Actinidia rufa]